MLGYLKRGEAYRRRQQLDSADARRQAAGRASIRPPIRPCATCGGPPSSIRWRRAPSSCWATSATRSAGSTRRRSDTRTYIKLDDRSPRVLYKLALAQYSGGRFGRRGHGAPEGGGDQRPVRRGVLPARPVFPRHAEARRLAARARNIRAHRPRDGARARRAGRSVRAARAHRRSHRAARSAASGSSRARHVRSRSAWRTRGAANSIDAVTTLGQAAEQYPDHSYTYVALGRVWLEKAQPHPDRVDLSKALGALEEAIGTDNSSEAMTLFGRALLLTQNVELAERVLQQATEKRPADPLAFYYLADAAERRGNAETARRALLDYRALEGDRPMRAAAPRWRRRIADLSMQRGDGRHSRRVVSARDRGGRRRCSAARARRRGPAAERRPRRRARHGRCWRSKRDPVNRAAILLQRRVR